MAGVQRAAWGALAALLLASPAQAGAAREVRLLMGTTAEVRVDAADPAGALDAAFAALALVDDTMSLWKPSALTRLNDAGEAAVPAPLLEVVSHALDVARASGGAFDPTVEPLVRASGGLGGPARELGAAERRRLLARVGARRVAVDPASGCIRLEPGTRLDLGGIAKGYAADRALAALRARGAASGLVDLGGSSLAGFGEPLELVVRDPESAEAPAWGRFQVNAGGVSTSGGDQRPGHILDPRTGLPARGTLAATVVAASAMEADALSTAVFVLGASEGLALLERRGAHGLVLTRESGRPVIRTTPGFERAHGLVVRNGVEVKP